MIVKQVLKVLHETIIFDIFDITEELEEELEEEEEEEEDDLEVEEDLRHDNWEIQMLAAELNRRESQLEERLSSGASEPNESSSGARQRLHLRSDTLDTDTENSEIETERVQRPRAASVDHTSSSMGPRQRSKGVLKALSFDRDKDQL